MIWHMAHENQGNIEENIFHCYHHHFICLTSSSGNECLLVALFR